MLIAGVIELRKIGMRHFLQSLTAMALLGLGFTQGGALGLAGTNDLGEFVVDAEKMTLYAFTSDRGGVSFCYRRCMQEWQPLIVDSDPSAGKGLDPSLVGTHERSDGSLQATYGGHPLYRYHQDEVPNDALGHALEAFGGQWFVVTPEGEPAMPEKAETAEEGDEAFDELMAAGEAIVNSRCTVCHSGGVGPAFEGNSRLGDREYVVFTILNGKGGGAMPAWRDILNDEEIAGAATFIRNVGANEFGPVSPEEVSSVRGH